MFPVLRRLVRVIDLHKRGSTCDEIHRACISSKDFNICVHSTFLGRTCNVFPYTCNIALEVAKPAFSEQS